MSTVYERVERITREKLSLDENQYVAPQSSFVDDLEADSLDLAELIMAFEEEFSTKDNPIEISDEDTGNIITINDAIAYLKDHGVENA